MIDVTTATKILPGTDLYAEAVDWLHTEGSGERSHTPRRRCNCPGLEPGQGHRMESGPMLQLSL